MNSEIPRAFLRTFETNKYIGHFYWSLKILRWRIFPLNLCSALLFVYCNLTLLSWSEEQFRLLSYKMCKCRGIRNLYLKTWIISSVRFRRASISKINNKGEFWDKGSIRDISVIGKTFWIFFVVPKRLFSIMQCRWKGIFINSSTVTYLKAIWIQS